MKSILKIWSSLILSIFIMVSLDSCTRGSEQEDVIYSDQTEQQQSDSEVQEQDSGTYEEDGEAEISEKMEDSIEDPSLDPEVGAINQGEGADAYPTLDNSVDNMEPGLDQDDVPNENPLTNNWENNESSNSGNEFAYSGNDSTSNSEITTNDSGINKTETNTTPIEIPDTTSSTDYNTQSSGMQNNTAPMDYSSNYTEPTGSELTYLVQPGDTLSAISQKIYGDAVYWSQIYKWNNLTNPDQIYPGDALKYQPNTASKAFDQTYGSVARKSITVKRGDSLSIIAKRVLGDGKAWKLIWAVNKKDISNPHQIQPNMVIYYFSKNSISNAFKGSKIKTRFGH